MTTKKVTVHCCDDCGCEVDFDNGYCAACDAFPAISTVLVDDDDRRPQSQICDSFAAGDMVVGGTPGSEDYDTGRVVEVDGDQVTVAWDSGVRTEQHSSRIEHAASTPRARRDHVTVDADGVATLAD
jgi:hypothetical protein